MMIELSDKELRSKLEAYGAKNRDHWSFRENTPGITTAVDTVLQTTVLQSVQGLVMGKINLEAKRVEYTLQRVGKLKQPWSGGILRDYAYHEARDAFDHDWTRTEQQ